MTKTNKLSLILIIAYPLVSIAVVFGIGAIDAWLLLSLVYPLIFGVAVPLLLLIVFWWIVLKKALQGSNWIPFPILATIVTLWCGVLHFYVMLMAAASV